jgi:arylsulfatase A-like enzyme
MKKSFYVIFLLGLSLSLKAADRPNILFIYADDQSTRTVSAYPDAYHWVNTPNIDHLASEGVLFRHAYIGSWCMPSRATMLTGLQQHAIESMRMEGPYPGSAYDADKCKFWPADFRKQGYYTAQIGKWHTGIDTGFGRDWDYQVVWNRPRYPENSPNYYYDQLIETNGQPPVMTKGYTTDNYTDLAIDFINGKNRDEKPWYLWLCYGAVHGPFTPADRHLDAYQDADTPQIADIYPGRPGKPEYADTMEFWEPGPNGEPVEKKRQGDTPVGMVDLPGRSLRDWVQQYHQGVLAIDENVGRLMETLRASGQLENTIVVYTADQGFAWGQHGMKGKVAPYHANVASPTIFRLPDRLANGSKSRGTVVDKPMSGVDIPVTFYSLAGLKAPWKMHGRDLTPLLRDPVASWNSPAMLVHTAKVYGSATNTIPGRDDPALYHGQGIPWYVMITKDRYKYVRNLVEGEVEELYDEMSDPDELRNLAMETEYKPLLKQYRNMAIEELKRTKAGFVNRLPSIATE